MPPFVLPLTVICLALAILVFWLAAKNRVATLGCIIASLILVCGLGTLFAAVVLAKGHP